MRISPFFLAAAVVCSAACNKTQVDGAKGRLSLSLKGDYMFGTSTKTVNLESYKSTNAYTVQIRNAKDRVVMECTGADLVLPKELEIGTYTAKAFYGTDVAASRNAIYVEGSKGFSIESGKDTEVSIDCVPTCGKISVEFDSDMSIYYNDYHVTYNGTRALGSTNITWLRDDTEPWYVKLDEEGETITYMIHLTLKDEYRYMDEKGNFHTSSLVTNSFTLKPNKAHKLKIKPNYSPAAAEGGVSVSITIDESTNDREYTIEVPNTWI